MILPKSGQISLASGILGSWVQGSGLRAPALGIRHQGSGFRVRVRAWGSGPLGRGPNGLKRHSYI